MRPTRVIFVNRFYWPDEPATGQLLTDLAEELVKQGHEVLILTSGRADAPPDEVHSGVLIRRVARSGNEQGALRKLLGWIKFGLGACWELSRLAHKGDQLVIMTDPPLLPLLAGPIARRRGAAAFHWVQDIYPELPERLNGWPGLGLVRRFRNREWRIAAGIVTLGSDMAKFIAAQGVAANRIHLLPNWAPAGLKPATAAAIARKRQDWGLDGKFVLAYSGNLGRVHALEPLLDVAAALQTDPAFTLLIIGRGAQLARFEAAVHERRLPNVVFQPPQPRDKLALTLGVGDVHFVTLRDGCEDLVFPSKFYGIAAVGRPMLFIGPAQSELARLIANHNLGGAFTAADIPAMVTLLRTWRNHPALPQSIGQQALAYHQSHPGLPAAAIGWKLLLGSPFSEPTTGHHPTTSP
jgi:glycosyltransferase involved in cell wall biosynthesis